MEVAYKTGRGKIKLIADLARVLEEPRAFGCRIVLAHGCFDLCHVGHVRHLEEAKRAGDVLVVTVTPDRFVSKGPNRPAFTESLRAEMLAALQCVDHVAVSDSANAVDVIKKLRPNVYVKGSECRSDPSGNIADEERAVAEIGGRMLFTETETFSSSALINRHLPTVPKAAQEWLAGFGHTAGEVNGLLDAAALLKVLVVGETIIDEYVWVKTLGKSGKEPVLVVEELASEQHQGGVYAIKAHVKSFAPMAEHLTGGDRIIKTRYVEQYPPQKAYEVYRGRERTAWHGDMTGAINDHSLVVVADYGHGMMGEDQSEFGSVPFLAVNVQNNAGNYGYNTHQRYGRIDYLCLSENELRLAARDRNGPLPPLVQQAAELHGCKYVTVTRGRDGVVCWAKDGGNGVPVLIDAPALTDHFADRVGAGDAVLAVTSLLACHGAAVDVLAFVANCVGALAVQVIGNREPVSKVALQKFIISLLRK